MTALVFLEREVQGGFQTMAATGLVCISVALYLFHLLCFIMPANRHETLRYGSLLGTEPLEGTKSTGKATLRQNQL